MEGIRHFIKLKYSEDAALLACWINQYCTQVSKMCLWSLQNHN